MTLRVPANRRPITPGAVLREDYLEPLQLTQQAVADAIGVDRTTLNEVLNARRGCHAGDGLAPRSCFWAGTAVLVEPADCSRPL